MVLSSETIAVVATWNVAASSAYYVRGAEYYLGTREPDGVWYAPRGDLGRQDTATVQPKEFARLYQGLGENGQSLITNSGGKADRRVPAFDLTFSAPRSVSLAWAFADDDLRRNLEAARRAPSAPPLATIEREAIYARRGKDGARIERVALTAALFQHGESRPAEHADGRVFGDPNLHTHAVVLNMATRADGTVGALHSTVLRDWKMAAGAVYHAALANEMADLGFDIDRVGRNGTFELAAVGDKAITYFSARRQAGAHYSPDDCPTDAPRHRRSPSSDRPLCRRNRPIGITAGNRLIGRCSRPPSHRPRKRPPAPLRGPPRAHVTASWTMAVERKATRPPRRARTGRRRSPDKEAGWSVEFEIDSALRVTDTDVQVLETYLGKQLDALFGGPHSPRNGTAVPDEAMNLQYGGGDDADGQHDDRSTPLAFSCDGALAHPYPPKPQHFHLRKSANPPEYGNVRADASPSSCSIRACRT
jgi:conjugative relaxase-like TrwC/TraI family protein